MESTEHTMAEQPSAAHLEFVSAQSRANPALSATSIADGADDVAARSTASSPAPGSTRVVLHRDASGIPYITDDAGRQLRVSSADNGGSASSGPGDATNVAIHHSRLFELRTSDDGRPTSSESALSDSTPPELSAAEYPQLDLDIDPDSLNATQIGQLNQIRAHLGTANARLVTTTAMLAEHQTATEATHNAIQAVRTEVVSRLDSLRNETNDQRSCLNHCLDDNLHVLRDTGASVTQVNLFSLAQLVRDRNSRLPVSVTNAMNSVVSPRKDNETVDEFEKRVAATLRTKEQTHAAFPLPEVLGVAASSGVDAGDARTMARNLPYVPGNFIPHNPAGDIARATVLHDFRRLQDMESSASRARFADDPVDRTRAPSVGMNTSVSGYHSGAGLDGRDVISEFADDMENIIRETIDHRVGTQLELLHHVRPAKIDNPSRYRGQDDHETFMNHLEKFLGWMRVSCYGGPELDAYRISLLNGYLEGDAHQWFVTEIDNPRALSDAPLQFADVICVLHRRYVKSSSAQRATRAFESVAWNTEKGPEKLMSDLIQHGQQMVDMPAPFVLKDRFMKLLPKWLSRELRVGRGLTSEFTPIETLRSHARQMWESEAVLYPCNIPEPPVDLPVAPEDAAVAIPTAHAPRIDSPGRFHSRAETCPANPAARAARIQDNLKPAAPRVDSTPRPPCTTEKKCFACGGDHYARDKICPRYNEQLPFRKKSRAIAAHRVERVSESYLDEDSDESNPENEAALLSGDEDQDDRVAPDLADLINGPNEEVRLQAMRGYAARPTLQYYSMRLVGDMAKDLETLGSDTETSLTASSVTPTEHIPTALGYNPGPVCVVCHDCALVCRHVPATPENGLPEGCTYSVCEHLANVGLDPNWVTLPASPQLRNVALPSASASYTSEEESTDEGSVPEPEFEDTFELGTIIDITASYPAEYTSAEREIQDFERARTLAGRRPLTALEYDVNLRLLRQYRYYSNEEADRDEEIANWSRQADVLRNVPAS
ncbi:hypothetical protein DFH07DRAFT_959243 [Mycena maculata]|uniref:Uncharacterized protein n=1 Tax=Mycena maculata TaxID=230809 RepID=A0AAD7J7H1_9AGAR|nr:hypothetical protein DFH07DRAFT_959243 [Mycena maculata]